MDLRLATLLHETPLDTGSTGEKNEYSGIPQNKLAPTDTHTQ